MRRMILVPLLIVLAVFAIGGGVGYWIYNNYMYYSTDDAQVTSSIVNVSAPTAGLLSTLGVKQGDRVVSGQSLATVTAASANGKGVANTVDVPSPINGTVLTTSAVPGQAVAPGLSLLQVTDLSAETVTAYVDEGAIHNVAIGQEVDIHLDAYSDTSFTGKVQRIVMATASEFSLLPTQDNASGNFTKVGQRIPVVISLDGVGGKALMPGMSVSVTIHIH
jgi:multidrug resistance efflux pump